MNAIIFIASIVFVVAKNQELVVFVNAINVVIVVVNSIATHVNIIVVKGFVNHVAIFL